MKPSPFSPVPALVAVFCMVAARTSVPLHAVDLKVDINQRSATNNVPANTEGGFAVFALDPTPTGGQSGEVIRTYGSQTVTLRSSLPGSFNYDDRKRTTGAFNQGDFNQQSLLQDFIFGVNVAAAPTNEGIDVEIGGLEAGKEYQITLWSFDTDSNGMRVSDWSANGVLEVEDYTFDGRVEPTTNEQYQMNFTSVADAAGKILLQGRRDSISVDAAGAASHGVFLNGFWVRDLVVDTEPDGMADGWETAHGLVVGTNDAALDPDNDFLSNLGEYQVQTDPQDNDSDNDTLLDGHENKSGAWVSATNTGTNPLVADTDGDGLADALENPDLPWTGPSQPGTNPNLADTDGDTFLDGEEINWPSNPRDPLLFPNPGAGATLAIDFESTAISAQPGFSTMDPSSGWTGNYGAQIVTVTPANTATLDHRDRAAAAGGAGFNPMFRDFVFAASSDLDGDGLDVTITNLAPLTYYPVTIWSWDPTSSATARHSTWLASDGDGPPVVKVPLYVHVGAALPTGAADRRMKFDALSDSFGQLVIQGRKEDGYSGSTINVFLNSLVIGPPVTPLRFTSVGPVSATGFPLTWVSDDVGVYRVQTSPDLTLWETLNAAVDGQAGTTSFNDTTAPAGTARRFYRVDRVSP